MSKSRVWKPSKEERIGWNHPYIQMTRRAPGYLVQELHGFADSTWQNKIVDHKDLIVVINRKPWIPLDNVERLCCANSEAETR